MGEYPDKKKEFTWKLEGNNLTLKHSRMMASDSEKQRKEWVHDLNQAIVSSGDPKVITYTIVVAAVLVVGVVVGNRDDS